MPEHLDGVGTDTRSTSAHATRSRAPGRASWRRGPRSGRSARSHPSVVFAIGRDATFAAAAAEAMPRLFAAAFRSSATSREFLSPTEPEAPPEPGPSGGAGAGRGDADAPASPCLALAWLARRLPAASLGDDERVLAERVCGGRSPRVPGPPTNVPPPPSS